MKYILGVDGGSTKTEINITDMHGRTVGQHISGASNYKVVGIQEAEKNINEGIKKAIGKKNMEEDFLFEASCFGFAGNDIEYDSRIFRHIVLNDWLKSHINESNIIICNDTRIGLAAGTGNSNGVIIICGTGSNCYGRNSEGKEAKANGWDYLLSDEGSGYSIGLKALRAVMRSYDGRGKKTLLKRELFKEYGLDSIESLLRWIYNEPFSKGKIASVSKVVCRTAGMHDEVSIEILRAEAGEVLLTVSTVVDKLSLQDRGFDLVFVGNVFRCKEFFFDKLIEKLREKYKHIILRPLTEKPVRGAIKMSLDIIKDQ